MGSAYLSLCEERGTILSDGLPDSRELIHESLQILCGAAHDLEEPYHTDDVLPLHLLQSTLPAPSASGCQ